MHYCSVDAAWYNSTKQHNHSMVAAKVSAETIMNTSAAQKNMCALLSRAWLRVGCLVAVARKTRQHTCFTWCSTHSRTRPRRLYRERQTRSACMTMHTTWHAHTSALFRSWSKADHHRVPVESAAPSMSVNVWHAANGTTAGIAPCNHKVEQYRRVDYMV